MPTQIRAGPHGFDKGLGLGAIGQLHRGAPASDAAVHRQGHDEREAIPSRQPSATEQVLRFHGRLCAKRCSGAQKSVYKQEVAQKYYSGRWGEEAGTCQPWCKLSTKSSTKQ